jgi:hypothetical protein
MLPRRTIDLRPQCPNQPDVRLKSDSKKRRISERNRIARLLKLPESSKKQNEQYEPLTASQLSLKDRLKKKNRHTLLLKRKRKKHLPSRLLPEQRKEAERRAKHKPQTRLRWASSDPG